MSGGILSAVAIFVSTWSPNVPVMIVLYGVLGGLGMGFMYLTSIVAVGHYFTRRRALAIGIAMGGCGVGSISFAPVLEFLISSYGWKGAMWIVSGICFNGVAMGALLRPINPGHNATVRLLQKLPSSCCRTEKEIDSGETTRHTCDWSNLFAFALLKQLSFLIYVASNDICLMCALADAYSNYNVTFYFAGSMLIFAGAISMPLRKIACWEQRRMCNLRQSVDSEVKSEKMMVKFVSVNRIQKRNGYDNFAVLDKVTDSI